MRVNASGVPVHKRRYDTKRAAKQAARNTQRSGGSALDVYRCPECSCWHVGHSSRKRSAAASKAGERRQGEGRSLPALGGTAEKQNAVGGLQPVGPTASK